LAIRSYGWNLSSLMPDASSPPTFAVVGHPNEGKSSVVATLAEDDRVRISDVPGETVASRAYPVRCDGVEILRFVDTPGFQHPHTILEWMRERSESVGNPAREFIEAHRPAPAFFQDLELLRPLAEGSGVIYVVDGSRPVRRHDLAEMEILRLLGNPRLALINPKEQGGEFLEDWKKACAKCFNATRVFHALEASYAERIALLENLKSIHQDWEPALARAIQAFQSDWSRRNARVAGLLCDLLREGLAHTESRGVFQTGTEDAAQTELVRQYQEAVSRLEQRAQAEIRRLFKHNIFNLAIPAQSILREDLFTEKTWQLLGLNRKQILLAAAALGAGLGLKLDLIFAHLSFGLFTVSGAALAAAAAWLKGENMARVRVKRLKLGGVRIQVGPNRNPQFPFVLMDRLLLYYQHTINWTHARRDSPPAPVASEPGQELKLGFTSAWSRERRQVCLHYLKALSGTNREKQDAAERAFLDMLKEVLLEISTRPANQSP
jgi:Domain of unknown function (DUF3482)/50S ribosome-binding GTPase